VDRKSNKILTISLQAVSAYVLMTSVLTNM